MNRSSSHGSGNRIPNAGCDAGRLIGDDQDVFAVIALEVLGLVGREANSEIVFVPKLEFGRLQRRIRDFGPLDRPTNLGPQLRPNLALGRRGRKNNALRIPRQPP
jgi:hypothetical protein